MNPQIRRIAILVAMLLTGASQAADFIVPVDMKSVSPSWTKGNVTCQISGPGMQPKNGYGTATLVNGAFKGNVNVTVDLTPADIPLAKNWYCSLGVGSSNGGSVIGPNGAPAAPNTPFKEHDNGAY